MTDHINRWLPRPPHRQAHFPTACMQPTSLNSNSSITSQDLYVSVSSPGIAAAFCNTPREPARNVCASFICRRFFPGLIQSCWLPTDDETTTHGDNRILTNLAQDNLAWHLVFTWRTTLRLHGQVPHRCCTSHGPTDHMAASFRLQSSLHRLLRLNAAAGDRPSDR